MVKKNNKILFGIFLVLILLSISGLLFFQKIETTGRAILQNKDSSNLLIDAITKGNTDLILKIKNQDKINYYIERINIEECEEINKIIPINVGETKSIDINCSKISNKRIVIAYKKQGNSELFYYKNIIKT